MKKFTAALSLAIFALLSIPVFYLSAQSAQELATPERTLQQEMSQLNLTLKEIVALLKQHVDSQEADLLIKRVDLNSRTLTSKREFLRNAKTQVVDLREEENMLTQTLESFENMKPNEDVDSYMEIEKSRIEQRIKALQERWQDLEREIVVHENVVMSEEENMRILKDVLDERLGLN